MIIYHLNVALYIVETEKGIYLYDTSWGRHSRNLTTAFIKKYLGYDEIQGIIISHFHNHHIHGASYLIEEFNGRVKEIYSGGVYADPKGHGNGYDSYKYQNEFDMTVEKYNIKHTHVKTGDLIDGWIEVLSPMPHRVEGLPTDSHGRRVNQDANDETGVIVKFKEGLFSTLLVGDMWLSGTEELIDNGIDLSATIYQFPHHGHLSPQYMSEKLFNAISPSLTILGTRPSGIQDAKDFIENNGSTWWHIGFDRENALGIKGFFDGTYEILENQPRKFIFPRAKNEL